MVTRTEESHIFRRTDATLYYNPWHSIVTQHSLECQLAALGLLPADLGGCFAPSGLSLGLEDRVTSVFTVNHARRHVVITVASNCVLGPCAAQAPHDSRLLGRACILKLL